jgi:hypothetical protein
MSHPLDGIDQVMRPDWRPAVPLIYAPDPKEVALSATFLDQLIKRSPEAEDILTECGRLRLQRAALAAIELYQEMSAGRTQGGK